MSIPSAARSRRPASPPREWTSNADAQLFFGAFGSDVGAVVERLVAAPTHVEHDADVNRVADGRLRGSGRYDEKKGNVDGQQDAHENKQLPHGAEKSSRERRGARIACWRVGSPVFSAAYDDSALVR